MVSEINSNPVFVDLHSASIARCPSVRRPDAFRPVHHLIDSDDRLGVYRDPANKELCEPETGMHEVRDGDGSSRARVSSRGSRRRTRRVSSTLNSLNASLLSFVNFLWHTLCAASAFDRPGTVISTPKYMLSWSNIHFSVTCAPVSRMRCRRKFTW